MVHTVGLSLPVVSLSPPPSLCPPNYIYTHTYVYISVWGFTLYIKTTAFLESMLTCQQLQVRVDVFGPEHSLHSLLPYLVCALGRENNVEEYGLPLRPVLET